MAKITISDADILAKIQSKYQTLIGESVDNILYELKNVGVNNEDLLTITNSKGEKLTLTTKELFDSFKTNITEGYALELLKVML